MLITATSIHEISDQIKEHVKNNTALISIGEHSKVNIPDLIELLNIDGLSFMGGIFPKVIHDNHIYDDAIIINTLYNVESLYVVKDISKCDYTIPSLSFTDSDYSLFTYVDGLTSNISNYLSSLYQNYGMQTTYFGGGAGSLSLTQQPCVFTNEGFFQDAAVVAVMKTKTNIGVKHGWEKVDGPFVITKAEGNTIQEINWKPSFDVYKYVVENHSHKVFDNQNFFDIAKGYPFGIIKNDAECIVRDPLTINEKNEVVCVGELEDNTLVDILYGDKDSLISAAENATKMSANQSKNPKKAIIIDCISRMLFLDKDFDKELSIITSTLKTRYPDISIGGALTIGEISSYGEGFLEFYNKTIVVGLFE
jgi:hypothetical protein